MAVTTKNEEALEAFEAALRARGEKLTGAEVVEIGASVLGGKKLQDGLRAAIYVEGVHQKAKDRDWDRLIPVDALLKTFREEL